jgi:hypothetical protein
MMSLVLIFVLAASLAAHLKIREQKLQRAVARDRATELSRWEGEGGAG